MNDGLRWGLLGSDYDRREGAEKSKHKTPELLPRSSKAISACGVLRGQDLEAKTSAHLFQKRKISFLSCVVVVGWIT